MQAAILFHPDGYLLDGPKLMGRQSAGNGLLRAAVAGRRGEPLICYASTRATLDVFDRAVKAIDPAAESRWIPASRLDLLARAGLLYRPDHAIAIPARLRLRAGAGAYSVCGVTHTLSSATAPRQIADLLTAPVMPWDALICTSRAALGVVDDLFARHAEYLGWRLGQRVALPQVQRPVIPLGVHAADYAITPAMRGSARAALGIAEDEVVALFAGRLSFSGKAHPVAMYRGLEETARRTGRRIVLIQAGSFFNASTEAVFRATAAEFCREVRALFVEGKDFTAYAGAWAAADLFVSLADNIQETFGLTPLEAMAAALPVVVSDWDGYRDTVRDGVDGFRIRAWMPRAGGAEIATDLESDANGYDQYLWRTAMAISVDHAQLVDRLSDLVTSPELRARLGEAGRRRARETFDWSVVYAQYRALWSEQDAIRRRLVAEPAWAERIAAAPRASSVHPDPFATFAGYPTHIVASGTIVTAAADADMARFKARTATIMHRTWNPPDPVVARVLEALGRGPLSVEALAGAAGMPVDQAIDAVARLAKLWLVTLEAP